MIPSHQIIHSNFDQSIIITFFRTQNQTKRYFLGDAVVVSRMTAAAVAVDSFLLKSKPTNLIDACLVGHADAEKGEKFFLQKENVFSIRLCRYSHRQIVTKALMLTEFMQKNIINE